MTNTTRMVMTKTVSALAAGILVATVLAGCSGGDDDVASAEETSTTQESSDETTPESPADDATSESSDTASDEASSDTSDDVVSSDPTTSSDASTPEGDVVAEGSGDFCTAFASFTSAQTELGQLDPSDPAAAAAAFDEFTTVLEDAEAPAEISAEWGTVAGGFRGLTDMLSDPANADPSEALGMLGDDSFMAALQSVAMYGATNC